MRKQTMSANELDVHCLATLVAGSTESELTSVAFHPTAALLATGSWDKTVKLWRPGKLSATLRGHSEAVKSVAFDPTGTLLASGSEDNTAKLWRLLPNNSSATCVATLMHTDCVSSVAFDPTGTLLATGSCDSTVKLWRLSADGANCVATLDKSNGGHIAVIRCVAFDPTGTLLATGSYDRTAKLWRLSPDNLADTTCVHTLMGHRGPVFSVAFDPTGTLLASGSEDNTAKLWRLSSATCVATLDKSNGGHTARVNSVAFHPTAPIMAPILATGSEDGKAKLWRLLPDNLKATACVATLEVDRGEVNSLAFDPTGTLLATAGKGTKLWDCRQFQRKNVTDDFRAMQRVIAGKLVGNSVKGHSSMKSAITRRAASGRNGEDWGRVYGVDPDMANMVRAHLNHLYRMRIKDGNVVTPFRFESVRHNKLLNDPADQSSDSEKKENKDGGSRARPRSKSKSKSKSKMMKRKRTTLKRKSHK